MVAGAKRLGMAPSAKGAPMKRLFLLIVGAGLVMTATAAYAGVAGPAFYVNGTTYRTVGTPPSHAHRRAGSQLRHDPDFGGAS